MFFWAGNSSLLKSFQVAGHLCRNSLKFLCCKNSLFSEIQCSQVTNTKIPFNTFQVTLLPFVSLGIFFKKTTFTTTKELVMLSLIAVKFFMNSPDVPHATNIHIGWFFENKFQTKCIIIIIIIIYWPLSCLTGPNVVCASIKHL